MTANSRFVPAPETQFAVEQFLYAQAEILDDARWDDWLPLFTEDGKYWMPAAADQQVAEVFSQDVGGSTNPDAPA